MGYFWRRFGEVAVFVFAVGATKDALAAAIAALMAGVVIASLLSIGVILCPEQRGNVSRELPRLRTPGR